MGGIIGMDPGQCRCPASSLPHRELSRADEVRRRLPGDALPLVGDQVDEHPLALGALQQAALVHLFWSVVRAVEAL